jgi:CDGSH-type Zn-finger protein
MYDQNKPYKIEEEAGTKFYCGCGKTKKPPYCDGSHKGSPLKPFKVDLKEKTTVHICGCGKSKNLPYCDGSHKK